MQHSSTRRSTHAKSFQEDCTRMAPKASQDFYQQRLKHWTPILTPCWVVLTLFLIGLPFLVIGLILKRASDDIVEYRTQYDGEGSTGPSACRLGVPGSVGVGTPAAGAGQCTISFPITRRMQAPVYVYYELSNFFQNHRRYVPSRDSAQLEGSVVTDTLQLQDCTPLLTTAGSSSVPGSKILQPCGLIANSFFNDTIRLVSPAGLAMSTRGIIWEQDRSQFRPIPEGTQAQFADQVQFIDETYPGLENQDDERLIVWMRAAAFPTFRKVYGRIDEDIPQGSTLTFAVDTAFPVQSFKGKKSLVVSTTNWMGGKNPFLGISYMALGALSLALAACFGVDQAVRGRGIGDTSYLRFDTKE